MAWDKTTPAGSESIRFGAGRIREMKEYLQNALSVEHNFPDSPTHKAGLIRCVEKDVPSSPNCLRWDSSQQALYVGDICVFDKDPFPAGTRTVFYQSSAPPGWSIISLSDVVVYISKGSANGGSQGGTVSGSWTITGLSSNAHTHTFDVASHSHLLPFGLYYDRIVYDSTPPWGYGDSFSSMSHYYGSSLFGSPVSSQYLISSGFVESTSSTSSSATPSVSHDGSWRPKGYVAILCERG